MGYGSSSIEIWILREMLRIDNSRQRVICTISLLSGTMILIVVQYISNERFDFSIEVIMNDFVIE